MRIEGLVPVGVRGRGFWFGRAGERRDMSFLQHGGQVFIDFAYMRGVSVLQHGVQVFIDFAYIRCVGSTLVVMALRNRVGLASTVDTCFWTSGLAGGGYSTSEAAGGLGRGLMRLR